MRRRRALTGLGLGIAAGAVAAGAIAQELDRPVVLHEYIAPPPGAAVINPRAPAGTGSELIGTESGPGQNPAAFRRDDKILPAPAMDRRTAPDEPVHGSRDFGADRQTETRPDYLTGADSTLHYIEVFNPSVVPFKRMSALDAVRDDYTLHVHETALEDLPVGGEPDPRRDLFWGSLAIRLTPGDDVPIPSVAPDMRILSYEIEPTTAVTFSKDGADNFYVRTDEAGSAREYRLVFLADASADHFAPTVPSGYRVRDLPSDRVHPMPRVVRASAERALRTLGLDRDADLRTAIDTLVYYFRAFEAKPSPPSSGDIFWDLFAHQAGVCRHRSFAFMITANALGIPTRYLSNEAHAWVEVWVPDDDDPSGRWLRVDLGGAADTLHVSNASDKAMYRPRREDSLPQPPEYSQNYTRLEGDVRGLSGEQIEEARSILPGPDGEEGLGEGDESASGRRTLAPGRKLPELPASAMAGKLPTSIAVTRVASEGFRGDTTRVDGRVVDADGNGLAGLRVDIYLAPAGFDGEYARLLGHSVTTTDGSFTVKVSLPGDLDLGDHEVFAATDGNTTHRPALSD